MKWDSKQFNRIYVAAVGADQGGLRRRRRYDIWDVLAWLSLAVFVLIVALAGAHYAGWL